MRDLPLGWSMKTIGEVCEKPQYGWTTKARKNGDAGLRLLRTTDITKGSIDWGTVPYCTDDPPEPEKYLLHDGDLVVSRAGSVGVSQRIRAPEPSVFASYLIRLRPRPDINTDYVAWFLKSPEYWEQVKQFTVGIALQNINAKKLASITLPVPPLDGQHRIVAAIEEQFSRLEAAEGSLTSAVARLRVLESAGLTIPKKQWSDVPLGEVTDNYDGRRVPVKKADREHRPGPYPYYGAQGVIDTIDDYLFDGDFLLVAEDGANLLSRVKPLAFRASGRFWVNNHAHVLTPRTGVTIEYLEIAVNSLDIQRSVTGSAQPKLTQANLNALPIPRPPVEVQAEIVSRWSLLSTGVKHLEGELRAAAGRLSHLRASIFRAAFSGRLVPEVLESDHSETVSA